MSATAFQRKRREKAVKLVEVNQELAASQEQITEYEDMTNDQLKALLDESGIEYKKSANKAELIDLLQGTDK